MNVKYFDTEFEIPDILVHKFVKDFVNLGIMVETYE